MGILPDKSADIGNKARVRSYAVHLKERVEFDGKRLFSAHQIDEPLDIMLYVPGILPGISLGIVAPAARCMRQQEGIERGAPFPLRVLATHQLGLGIEQRLVSTRPFHEELVVLVLPHGFGHLGSAIVVVGRLQRAGYRLDRNNVVGVIAILVVGLPIRFLVTHGQRGLDGIIGIFGTESFKTLQIGIDNHRHGMVGNHAIGFLVP